MSLFMEMILISTPYLPCKQQVATSNTGPILVFPWIHPFGCDASSSPGRVYPRKAAARNCKNSAVSFVMKYCPISTTCRNPASIQNFACVLRLLTGSSPSGFRGAPRGEHLSIRVRSYHDQLHGPIRFPRHLFSVHDHGRQRSGRGPQHTFLPLRWPDCTLSRLRAEEYDRPVTQSIATPEPSSRTIPTLDQTLVAR